MLCHDRICSHTKGIVAALRCDNGGRPNEMNLPTSNRSRTWKAIRATAKGRRVRRARPVQACRRLVVCIAKNHGSKRTASAATDLFLFFNGLDVEASQQDIIQFVLMVAAGEIDETGATAFFRDHTVPVET